jgi:MFS transporter, DHA1 family, multidrug resistance protein
MVNNSWRKNLYVMFIAELVVMTGFSFVQPFIPLYIQQLGGLNDTGAAFWSGLAISGTGIGMVISSPIWGLLADRMGRKPMVLRAMIGGGVIIGLQGFAPNIYIFCLLRIIQGLFGGTVAAASALVTSSSPRDKTGYVMGILMLALYVGTAIGPTIGGFSAHAFGYRITFFVTAALLVIGGLLVQFLIKETFQPPAQKVSFKSMWQLARSKNFYPLLITSGVISLGFQTTQPIVPLLMSQLGSPDTAAVLSGLAFALLGVTTAISSVISGRLIGRVSPKKVLIIACIGTGLLYILPIFAANALQLIIFVGIVGLLQGSAITSATSMIGISVLIAEQGMAYGLSQSANSIGFSIGPIIGGSAAQIISFNYIFGLSTIFFIFIGLFASKYVVVKTPKEVSQPAE